MKSNLKVIFSTWIIVALTSCNHFSSNRTITIKGSETMLPLLTELANYHNKLQSKPLKFEIEGGGSQAGIDALLEDDVDIAMSSKLFTNSLLDTATMKKESIAKLDIAWDKLIIVVNNQNQTLRITSEQLRKIYSGEIKTWASLGGNNSPITPVSRMEGSGSLSNFKDKVMHGKDFAESVVQTGTVKEILRKVEEDPNAIAFIGGGHFSKSIKVLDVSADGNEYFYPSERNVRNGSYPYIMLLSIYYRHDSKKKAMHTFVHSIEKRRIRQLIRKLDFVPFTSE